jgi:hypothetical protein
VHVEGRARDAEPRIDVFLCRLVQRAAAGTAAGCEHLARGLLVERPFEQHDARLDDQAAQARAEVAREEMRRAA